MIQFYLNPFVSPAFVEVQGYIAGVTLILILRLKRHCVKELLISPHCSRFKMRRQENFLLDSWLKWVVTDGEAELRLGVSTTSLSGPCGVVRQPDTLAPPRWPYYSASPPLWKLEEPTRRVPGPPPHFIFHPSLQGFPLMTES